MNNDDEIICYCSNVYKSDILKALKEGAKDIDDIRKITSACTIGRCNELSPLKKCCSKSIINIIDDYNK